MVVTSLHIYPVKSLAGLSVPEGEVEPWGLHRRPALACAELRTVGC